MQGVRASGTANEVACGKFPTNVPFKGTRLEFELAGGRELSNGIVGAVEFPSTDMKGGRSGSGYVVHCCCTT